MVRKVLIVDDHEPLRRRIRSALEGEGLEVCGEAANGLEAIQKVKEHAPAVVILNISMPIMNGLQALPEIVRCSPGTKVLMFTLDDAQELRRKALDLGASAYISKAASIGDLVAEVKKLLAATAKSSSAENSCPVDLPPFTNSPANVSFENCHLRDASPSIELLYSGGIIDIRLQWVPHPSFLTVGSLLCAAAAALAPTRFLRVRFFRALRFLRSGCTTYNGL